MIDSKQSKRMAGPSSARYNWQVPQTAIYEDNYRYAINSYQPMIDYLDDKSQGRMAAYPHLPWTNERGLDRYSSRSGVLNYSEAELNRLARQTEASARRSLHDFKATAKSSFQLSKSVSASRLSSNLQTERRKTHKHQLYQASQAQSRMADEYSSFSHDAERAAERELKQMQKYLRGKSAKNIESQLLSKSRRNIAEAYEADVAEQTSFQQQVSHSSKAHVKLLERRIVSQIDDDLLVPLDRISSELRGYNLQSAAFLRDKR